MKSLWIVPETSGGIRSYAENLISEMGDECRAIWHLPDVAEVEKTSENLVHIQHEFGLFGSKLPGFYRFPGWLRRVKKTSRPRKWIATAHTVLDRNWRYHPTGSGIRAGLLRVLNFAMIPFVRNLWIQGTWGSLDGVIVHSRHQIGTVRSSGCKRVEVIPHFVPTVTQIVSNQTRDPSVLLFGYFSPEKGQDIAIRAWALLGSEAPTLVLAGGVRRKEDQGYYDSCIREIARRNLTQKIIVTGYVQAEEIASLFARASLVIAPFRETSGSGSLATAFGHGSAVLASDLVLNQEIVERVPGSLSFFQSESPESLMSEVTTLMASSDRLERLRERARHYAETYSPQEIARLHRSFYEKVLGKEMGANP